MKKPNPGKLTLPKTYEDIHYIGESTLPPEVNNTLRYDLHQSLYGTVWNNLIEHTQITCPDWVRHQNGAINSLHVHPNGERLVTVSDDGFLNIWNTSAIYDISSQSNPFVTNNTLAIGLGISCNTVRFSPDGFYLAAGCDDGKVYIYRQTLETYQELGKEKSLESWTLCYVLSKHTSSVNDLAWSPNSQMLVTGSVDNLVILWAIPPPVIDPHTGFVLTTNFTSLTPSTIAVCEGHTSWVTGVAFDPLGMYVASQDILGVVIIWRFSKTLRDGVEIDTVKKTTSFYAYISPSTVNQTPHATHAAHIDAPSSTAAGANPPGGKTRKRQRASKAATTDPTGDSDNTATTGRASKRANNPNTSTTRTNNNPQPPAAQAGINLLNTKSSFSRLSFSPDGSYLLTARGTNSLGSQHTSLDDTTPTCISCQFQRETWRIVNQYVCGYTPTTVASYNPQLFDALIIPQAGSITATAKQPPNAKPTQHTQHQDPTPSDHTTASPTTAESLSQATPTTPAESDTPATTTRRRKSSRISTSASSSAQLAQEQQPQQQQHPLVVSPLSSGGSNLHTQHSTPSHSPPSRLPRLTSTSTPLFSRIHNPSLALPASFNTTSIRHSIEAFHSCPHADALHNTQLQTYSLFALGSVDGTVSIWSTTSFYPILVIPSTSSQPVTDLTWSLDGHALFISFFGYIHVVRFGFYDCGLLKPHNVFYDSIQKLSSQRPLNTTALSRFDRNYNGLDNPLRSLQEDSSKHPSATTSTSRMLQQQQQQQQQSSSTMLSSPLPTTSAEGITSTGLPSVLSPSTLSTTIASQTNPSSSAISPQSSSSSSSSAAAATTTTTTATTATSSVFSSNRCGIDERVHVLLRPTEAGVVGTYIGNLANSLAQTFMLDMIYRNECSELPIFAAKGYDETSSDGHADGDGDGDGDGSSLDDQSTSPFSPSPPRTSSSGEDDDSHNDDEEEPHPSQKSQTSKKGKKTTKANGGNTNAPAVKGKNTTSTPSSKASTTTPRSKRKSAMDDFIVDSDSEDHNVMEKLRSMDFDLMDDELDSVMLLSRRGSDSEDDQDEDDEDEDEDDDEDITPAVSTRTHQNALLLREYLWAITTYIDRFMQCERLHYRKNQPGGAGGGSAGAANAFSKSKITSYPPPLPLPRVTVDDIIFMREERRGITLAIDLDLARDDHGNIIPEADISFYGRCYNHLREEVEVNVLSVRSKKTGEVVQPVQSIGGESTAVATSTTLISPTAGTTGHSTSVSTATATATAAPQQTSDVGSVNSPTPHPTPLNTPFGTPSPFNPISPSENSSVTTLLPTSKRSQSTPESTTVLENTLLETLQKLSKALADKPSDRASTLSNKTQLVSLFSSILGGDEALDSLSLTRPPQINPQQTRLVKQLTAQLASQQEIHKYELERATAKSPARVSSSLSTSTDEEGLILPKPTFEVTLCPQSLGKTGSTQPHHQTAIYSYQRRLVLGTASTRLPSWVLSPAFPSTDTAIPSPGASSSTLEVRARTHLTLHLPSHHQRGATGQVRPDDFNITTPMTKDPPSHITVSHSELTSRLVDVQTTITLFLSCSQHHPDNVIFHINEVGQLMTLEHVTPDYVVYILCVHAPLQYRLTFLHLPTLQVSMSVPLPSCPYALSTPQTNFPVHRVGQPHNTTTTTTTTTPPPTQLFSITLCNGDVLVYNLPTLRATKTSITPILPHTSTPPQPPSRTSASTSLSPLPPPLPPLSVRCFSDSLLITIGSSYFIYQYAFASGEMTLVESSPSSSSSSSSSTPSPSPSPPSTVGKPSGEHDWVVVQLPRPVRAPHLSIASFLSSLQDPHIQWVHRLIANGEPLWLQLSGIGFIDPPLRSLHRLSPADHIGIRVASSVKNDTMCVFTMVIHEFVAFLETQLVLIYTHQKDAGIIKYFRSLFRYIRTLLSLLDYLHGLLLEATPGSTKPIRYSHKPPLQPGVGGVGMHRSPQLNLLHHTLLYRLSRLMAIIASPKASDGSNGGDSDVSAPSSLGMDMDDDDTSSSSPTTSPTAWSTSPPTTAGLFRYFDKQLRKALLSLSQAQYEQVVSTARTLALNAETSHCQLMANYLGQTT